MQKNNPERNRSTDIILVLKPMEGKKPLSAAGMVDNRLFNGENNLHAIMDTQTCLWRLTIDNGILPPVLRQQFTGFSRLLNFVKGYYDRRNVEIAEIRD